MSVILNLPDTPQARESERVFDKLDQLLNCHLFSGGKDELETTRRLDAIAEFIQFGRKYRLTIEELGAIEP